MIKRVAAGLFVILFLFAGDARPDRSEKEYAEYKFARVQYNPSGRGCAGQFNSFYNQQRQPPWQHDYPHSEDFFLGMVAGVTGIHTNVEAYKIVRLDSEEIFEYPFLYIAEPGYIDLSSEEEEKLRQFFNRGGFAMFDDFRGLECLYNLEQQMLRLFPNRRMERLEINEPIFHSFYDIDSLDMVPPYGTNPPTFWGMRDEDDRLIMIANADNDFGEYWEYIDNGARPLEPGVQSFQFGVNYLIYAMTH
jgi:hypothetical protein